MFNPNPLSLSDGYKPSHVFMLAPNTTRLYGTWIPRKLKYAPKAIKKIVSFGQQLTWIHIHDMFEEHFFFTKEKDLHTFNTIDGYLSNKDLKAKALQFVKDMSLYLGMEYDGKHFEELWDLGYLPIKVKSLPEGIETDPNIPHMTFINTVDGFAWLTLYLETIVSNLAWKPAYAATVAKLYRRQAEEWVKKTDPDNMWLVDYMCHDFSARGLAGPHDMVSVGLGHATSFRGSDTLVTIPAARYYYGESEHEVCINSVNASEHSVSTTKIFTVGEQQMITDWLKIFPKGILSIVADTFDLWKLITEYLPANKEAIMARDGKLVIRPDSGNPVDIICGTDNSIIDNSSYTDKIIGKGKLIRKARKAIEAQQKGVVELLWDIFGGTINEQGYKVLDPHIGAIYGDSITPERQYEIYQKLAAKGFAATNIVLGVGSRTYQHTTRDWASMAAKGSWFEIEVPDETCGGNLRYDSNKGKWYKSYNIYKDPVTDDGTKKSLKGMLQVFNNNPNCNGGDIMYNENDNFIVNQECTLEQEQGGLLQVIYEDGKFYNETTLTKIRQRLSKLN